MKLNGESFQQKLHDIQFKFAHGQTTREEYLAEVAEFCDGLVLESNKAIEHLAEASAKILFKHRTIFWAGFFWGSLVTPFAIWFFLKMLA